MTTRILSIQDPQAREQAALIVRQGGVVAFPTDTVYGIGVSAFDRKAVEKIYQLKNRPRGKAIPILLADRDDLSLVSQTPEEDIETIIRSFWPGALTLILPKNPALPDNLSPTATIGVRVPDHDQTRQLIRKTGPLAATSANLSGQPGGRSASEVQEQFQDRLDLILDGGPSAGRPPSTVLDCTGPPLKILRQGPITREEILKAISG